MIRYAPALFGKHPTALGRDDLWRRVRGSSLTLHKGAAPSDVDDTCKRGKLSYPCGPLYWERGDHSVVLITHPWIEFLQGGTVGYFLLVSPSGAPLVNGSVGTSGANLILPTIAVCPDIMLRLPEIELPFGVLP